MDEDAGGVAELMALAAETLFLQVAELVERFLELAGEAGAVEREFGELVDDDSGGSSEGRTVVAAERPWRSALREERCLPDAVRGPVE